MRDPFELPVLYLVNAGPADSRLDEQGQEAAIEAQRFLSFTPLGKVYASDTDCGMAMAHAISSQVELDRDLLNPEEWMKYAKLESDAPLVIITHDTEYEIGQVRLIYKDEMVAC